MCAEGPFETPSTAITSAVRSLRARILGKADGEAQTVTWDPFDRQISRIFTDLTQDEEVKSWRAVAFKSHLMRFESDLRDAGTAIDGTEPRARTTTCYVILEATGSSADTSPAAKRSCTHKMKATTCNLARKLHHIV